MIFFFLFVCLVAIVKRQQKFKINNLIKGFLQLLFESFYVIVFSCQTKSHRVELHYVLVVVYFFCFEINGHNSAIVRKSF